MEKKNPDTRDKRISAFSSSTLEFCNAMERVQTHWRAKIWSFHWFEFHRFLWKKNTVVMLRGFSGGVGSECVRSEFDGGMDSLSNGMAKHLMVGNPLLCTANTRVMYKLPVSSHADKLRAARLINSFWVWIKIKIVHMQKQLQGRTSPEQSGLCWIKLRGRTLVLKLFSSGIILYSQCRSTSRIRSVKVTSWLSKTVGWLKSESREKLWNFPTLTTGIFSFPFAAPEYQILEAICRKKVCLKM